MSSTLVDEFVDMESQYDEAKRNLNGLLEWKTNKKRVHLNLPKIDETKKYVVLGNNKDRIRLARNLVNDTRDNSCSTAHSITNPLLEENLLSNYEEDTLLDVESLQESRTYDKTEFGKRIKQLSMIDNELNWKILTKPYGHW